jgi:fructose-specific phosphotransferase system IIC component
MRARAVVVTVVALIGGFLAGIVVSEVIGAVGLLVFDSIVGIRFLPVVTAVVAAGAAIIVNRRAERRSASAPPLPPSAEDQEAR